MLNLRLSLWLNLWLNLWLTDSRSVPPLSIMSSSKSSSSSSLENPLNRDTSFCELALYAEILEARLALPTWLDMGMGGGIVTTTGCF